MKKTMAVAAFAALGSIAAPMASADAYPAWQALGHSGNVQVQSSSSLQYGGWCDHGRPASALAIRTTSGTKTVHIFYTTLVDDELRAAEKTVVATTAGQVIAVPFAGSNIQVLVDVSTTASDTDSFTKGASVIAPEKCGTLPNHLPALPAAWGSTKPTKPVPTHTTHPAPVTPTPTHTTTMPSQPGKPGTGPKVETDMVGGSNNSTELAIGGAIGALALVGGGTVVARRRR